MTGADLALKKVLSLGARHRAPYMSTPSRKSQPITDKSNYLTVHYEVNSKMKKKSCIVTFGIRIQKVDAALRSPSTAPETETTAPVRRCVARSPSVAPRARAIPGEEGGHRLPAAAPGQRPVSRRSSELSADRSVARRLSLAPVPRRPRSSRPRTWTAGSVGAEIVRIGGSQGLACDPSQSGCREGRHTSLSVGGVRGLGGPAGGGSRSGGGTAVAGREQRCPEL